MAWWNDPQIPIIDTEALVTEWEAAMAEAAQRARTLAITKYIGRHRPEYPPLADSTIRRKKHDRPLLDTARLRNSIQAKVVVVRFGGQVKVWGVVGTNVEYARAHEYGTTDGRVPARPFLEPAVNEVIDRFGRRIGTAPARCVRYV
jgi:phage gpG-like protein